MSQTAPSKFLIAGYFGKTKYDEDEKYRQILKQQQHEKANCSNQYDR